MAAVKELLRVERTEHLVLEITHSTKKQNWKILNFREIYIKLRHLQKLQNSRDRDKPKIVSD